MHFSCSGCFYGHSEINMLRFSNFHRDVDKVFFFKFRATLGAPAQGLCCIQILVWKKSGNFFFKAWEPCMCV